MPLGPYHTETQDGHGKYDGQPEFFIDSSRDKLQEGCIVLVFREMNIVSSFAIPMEAVDGIVEIAQSSQKRVRDFIKRKTEMN